MKYLKLFENFHITEQMVTDVLLYHGSNMSFDEFDDDKISTGDGSDLFGKGYYLTDNKKVAEFYAKMMTKKEKIIKHTSDGIFGSPVPHYSNDADEYADKNFHINVFKIHANILNVKTYILDDSFVEFIKKTYKECCAGSVQIVDDAISFMRNNKEDIRDFRGEIWYIIYRFGFEENIKKSLISYIRKLGYDGLKYEPDKEYENTNSWNYVIYNKNVIRKVK